eukprot:CAMPEP_0182488088 /NCGR_PEP_ID=MMETSP1319-20130603/48232_1 /TAXON_ID=172717 /ORGANISM="Bolidomonas pacifica, Strain RCC208" /LENGTH=180 /DNA_ID=CAMNT_0024690215 /DNA_START=1414 /DNA_END=1952 /DNA_ORIENTATION=-
MTSTTSTTTSSAVDIPPHPILRLFVNPNGPNSSSTPSIPLNTLDTLNPPLTLTSLQRVLNLDSPLLIVTSLNPSIPPTTPPYHPNVMLSSVTQPHIVFAGEIQHDELYSPEIQINDLCSLTSLTALTRLPAKSGESAAPRPPKPPLLITDLVPPSLKHLYSPSHPSVQLLYEFLTLSPSP